MSLLYKVNVCSGHQFQLYNASLSTLESGDLLGIVPPSVEFVEEGLGWWWVVVLLEPVQDVGLNISSCLISCQRELTSCFQQFMVS